MHRLSLNDAAMRTEIVRGLEVMSSTWGEEVEDKFSYWADFPHLLLGCWPADRAGVAHTKHCLQLWSRLETQGEADKCHRVTFKMLHPSANTVFPMLLNNFVASGDMHADLVIELQDMNVAATCEQNIEGAHAIIHQVFQVDHCEIRVISAGFDGGVSETWRCF